MTDDSLARIDSLREIGKRIAAYLRDNPRAFQEQAAIVAGGISRATYWRYMREEDEASLAFQAEVLPAVFERAQFDEEKAEQDIACVEAGSSAWAGWHKWKLSQRYRKIFGDLAQEPVKVELTGKDGGAIAVTARPPTRAEAFAELRELAKSDPEVAKLLREAGGNAESVDEG